MDEASTPLSQATEEHLRALAGLTYPQALTGQFPRIANQIVALKDNESGLRHYFDELTHDHRGGRHGFPFDVLMDILALRERMLEDATPDLNANDDTKWVS